MAKFLEPKNPVMNESTFEKALVDGVTYEPMTISGAINKSLLLLVILFFTSGVAFLMPSSFLLYTGIIGGLIAVLVASFKPHTSPITAPVYAAFEGLFVGSISAYYAAQFQGIIFQAVMLTMGTLAVMLAVYKFEIIKVTEKLKTGVIMATGAIFLTYLISWIFSFFGAHIPYIHEGGLMGIGFSVVVIGIASLNLLLDFDMIEKGEQQKAPAYMEWYGALGLMVTLVWLYIEFLRLLAKLNRD